MRGNGVRAETESIFGLTYKSVGASSYFQGNMHLDVCSNCKGIYNNFPSGTPAVTSWFPFMDVDPEKQGGSIRLLRGYVNSECKYKACGGVLNPSRSLIPQSLNCTPQQCWKTNCPVHSTLGCDDRSDEVFITFKKGDLLFYHPETPHGTQRW